MLISYEHKFLFVHVGKAAGSSIERALQSHAVPVTGNKVRRRLSLLGPLNRIGGLYRQVEFGHHTPLRTVQRCLPPREFDPLFKFAFVRNPWDRVVSRFHFLKKQTDHHRHELVTRMKSFEDYVEWEINRAKMFQHKLVTDLDGKVRLDFVGRFERLEEDFQELCEKLSLNAALPHLNQSQHRDYRSYYTPELRDRVGEFFKRDVELFGYTFDGFKD